MDWGNLLKWLVPVASEKGRNFLFGGPDTFNKLETGTPEQQELHKNTISQAMGMQQPGGGQNLANQYYNNFLNENKQQAYDQFSSPYLQQFKEQILPQIAEHFAGGGALSSSGFGQSLGGAASGLQAQLAKLFSDLQSQAAHQQYGQYNQNVQSGLNYQPFGYQKQKGSAGFLPTLLSAAGAAFGGGAGGALGDAAGKGIGDLFKSVQNTGGIS